MRTLITDPFEDDAISLLEWAYGPKAKHYMIERMAMGQRTGQAFMNALSMFDLESYSRLTDSMVDPFHKDENIPAALDLMTTKDVRHFAYHTKNNTFTERTACGCSKGENHWLSDGE